MKTYRYDLIQQDPVPCLRVREEIPNSGMMNSPEECKEWITSVVPFHEYCDEYVYLVTTSTKNIPLGVFELSHGAIDFSIMDIRACMHRVLLTGAPSFFVVHNHPSGITTPSNEDISITKKLKEAADFLKIRFIDHLIIGDSYYSFREHGHL